MILRTISMISVPKSKLSAGDPLRGWDLDPAPTKNPNMLSHIFFIHLIAEIKRVGGRRAG